MFEKIIGIILRTVFPVICGIAVTFALLSSNCSSFKIYDSSDIKEENIYYTTLSFYAQKDKEKNDVVIKEAMDRLYKKLDENHIDKEIFCKQVSFGENDIDKKDIRYINYLYCTSKKIVVE
jgi:hypothetical protein